MQSLKNETLTTCTARIMSWKLRWAGWNKGMKRYTKPDGSYGYSFAAPSVMKWLYDRKEVNKELSKTARMNAILLGKIKLVPMPKSIVKEKLIEWCESERMQGSWNDTADARNSGDPKDLGHLLPAWKRWKKSQGYK